MINLIPESSKKDVKVEYWCRVIGVWFFLFGTGVLVGAVFFIPTYVLIETQTVGYLTEYGETNEKLEQLPEIETVVNKSNQIASIIMDERENIPALRLLRKVEEVSGEKVSISMVEIRPVGSEEPRMSVSGVAKDRFDLMQFRSDMESSPFFGDIDLPLTQYASERDINFNLLVPLINE